MEQLIKEAGQLVHVSPLANLASILERGLVSPAKAVEYLSVPGIGSDKSNQAVVQLFDYTLVGVSDAVRQLNNLLVSDHGHQCFKDGVAIMIVKNEIRKENSFAGRSAVIEWRDEDDTRRTYPSTEVWWRGDLDPSKFAGHKKKTAGDIAALSEAFTV